MDPITQGVLGAAAAEAVLRRESSRLKEKLGPEPLARPWFFGTLGGMAADLDVLIRSSADPLLKIEYHRHFTHSLAFVPVGGLLVALPWILRKKHRAHWKWILAATVIGYATHGLLDACTTYGTLLWWPFSSRRESWSLISIIDPLFTFPMMGLVIASARRKAARFATLGLAWGLLYMSLGGLQHYRALRAQQALASLRGHEIARGEVFPAFLNNVTWRSLYEAGGVLYADKIRVPWYGEAVASEGASVAALDEARLPAGVNEHPETRRGLRLIKWFSSDWVALDPRDPTVIADVRYSFSPGELEPIWGVRLSPAAAAPVEWVNNRRRRGIDGAHVWALIFEDGPRPRPLGAWLPRAISQPGSCPTC